jgi:hypothetical protein
MDSKYLQAASEAVVQAAKLNDVQIKQVREYENQIKLMRQSQSEAHKLINQDVSDKKISNIDGNFEKAKVNLNIDKTVAEIELAIRQIFPAWTSTALEAARQYSDKAAQLTVKGSDKLGNGLGILLNTPF